MTDPHQPEPGDPVPSGRPRRPERRTPTRPAPPTAGLAGRLLSGRSVQRWPIVVSIVALLVIGGLVDRSSSSARPASSGPGLPAVPVAAPADALSSSWFCAGATGSPNGPAPGAVIIANTQDHPITATVKLVPTGGPGVTSTASVPARGRTAVAETLPGSPAGIAAAVTLDGGAAAVEQQVTGPLGTSATPCATSGSQTWYFTSGLTAINATDAISLFNPYPVDAIVDLTFTTDQGLEAPGEFQAVVVPASGLVTLDLGSHLRRRARIATAVTARSGRIVAWQTRVVAPDASATSIDPASPVSGVTVSLGSPSAAVRWVWPDGLSGNGVNESYEIYNPGPGTASVQLSVNLDQGSAEPFTLSVGPEEVATVVSDNQARVPPGVTHSAVLRSVNGVGVVAERTVAAASPSARVGLGELDGERLASPSWLFAAGGTNAKSDEWVVLFNPGSTAVRAVVTGLSQPIAGLGPALVPPGGRVAVEVNAHAASFDSSIVVQASGPLFAERDLYGAARQPGYGLSAGVPLTP